MRDFVVSADRFVRNGEPIRIFSGSLHYTRVPRAYWRDRLLRLRALGLNTVCTYIPWALHQPAFDVPPSFEGELDVAYFVREAQSCGLMVLLRLGPYIDAEYDLGALPGWLLGPRAGIKQLRTNDTNYLRYVQRWYSALLPPLKSLLWQAGGPVVMVQIENEYGAFVEAGGTSRSRADAYKRALHSQVRSVLGPRILVFTTDGDREAEMRSGRLDAAMDANVIATNDFGPGDPDYGGQAELARAYALQKRMNPTGRAAALCSEFYAGWGAFFNASSPAAPRTSGGALATALKQWLSMGNTSLNLYMAHGGTTFGNWAGGDCTLAGDACGYAAIETTYDFNAPIAEGGDHGIGSDGVDKFNAVREALRPYNAHLPLPPEPPLPPRMSYGHVEMRPSTASLFDVLPTLVPSGPSVSDMPRSMEANGGPFYGFGLYTTRMDAPALRDGTMAPWMERTLRIDGGARDRVIAFVDGSAVGTLWRGDADSSKLRVPDGRRLALLVENTGRIAYGGSMGTDAFKGTGVVGGVYVDGVQLSGPWSYWPLPLDARMLQQWAAIEAARAQPSMTVEATDTAPRLYVGSWEAVTAADCWVHLDGWLKGTVVVNGRSLGRYWSIGPQHALYLPAPFVRVGRNEILILELHPRAAALGNASVTLLGHS